MPAQFGIIAYPKYEVNQKITGFLGVFGPFPIGMPKPLSRATPVFSACKRPGNKKIWISPDSHIP